MNASYKQKPEYKEKQRRYVQDIKHSERYKKKRIEYTRVQRTKTYYMEWSRQYKARPEYKQKRVELETERRKNNIQVRLRHYLRARLRSAIKNKQKTGSAIRDLGCSIKSLMGHIERQFQAGMTWENMGEWHVDHIRPLSSFDLADREQLLEACNYRNLQPLWAKDNLAKNNKDPIKFARSLGLLL